LAVAEPDGRTLEQLIADAQPLDIVTIVEATTN